MKNHLEERTICIAKHIAEKNSTVRAAAFAFGLSKSTVHKDMDERLKQLDPELYLQVRRVLAHNKSVRHLRGGEATRRKFRGESRG